MDAAPSWSSPNDKRDNGSLLNDASWKERLAAIESSNIDFMVQDTKDESNNISSMIVASKKAMPELRFKEVLVIKALDVSEATETFCDNIVTFISALGLLVQAVSLKDATTENADGKMLISGKSVISLLEAQTPFVLTLSEISDQAKDDFTLLQKLLLGSLGGLWVGRGGRQIDPLGNPLFSTTNGLLRTIRNEKPEIMMHELNLSSIIQLDSLGAAGLGVRSLKSIFEADSLGITAETELSELNG